MPPVVPPPFDAITAGGMTLLAVIVVIAWAVTWSHGNRALCTRLLVGAAMVMGLSALLARSGLLQRFDVAPPPMAVMIVAVLVLAVVLGMSRVGRTVAADVPLVAQIGLQAFRLPLELVMHRAATLGIMPEELTYTGYNFDIVTGAGALVLWALLRARIAVPRWCVWLWNVWGIYCLAAIFVIAVTTSPMLRLFGDDPRHLNTWVLYMPYVWLPVVLVTIALAGHVVVTRSLRQRASPVLSRR